MKTTIILAALAILGATPALAQDVPTRSIAISYSDLDLGSAAGRDALDGRIRQAIRQVCGTASPADLRGQNRVDDCREELAERAAVQRDVALASVSRSRSPSPPAADADASAAHRPQAPRRCAANRAADLPRRYEAMVRLARFSTPFSA